MSRLDQAKSSAIAGMSAVRSASVNSTTGFLNTLSSAVNKMSDDAATAKANTGLREYSNYMQAAIQNDDFYKNEQGEPLNDEETIAKVNKLSAEWQEQNRSSYGGFAWRKLDSSINASLNNYSSTALSKAYSVGEAYKVEEANKYLKDYIANGAPTDFKQMAQNTFTEDDIASMSVREKEWYDSIMSDNPPQEATAMYLGLSFAKDMRALGFTEAEIAEAVENNMPNFAMTEFVNIASDYYATEVINGKMEESDFYHWLYSSIDKEYAGYMTNDGNEEEGSEWKPIIPGVDRELSQEEINSIVSRVQGKVKPMKTTATSNAEQNLKTATEALTAKEETGEWITSDDFNDAFSNVDVRFLSGENLQVYNAWKSNAKNNDAVNEAIRICTDVDNYIGSGEESDTEDYYYSEYGNASPATQAVLRTIVNGGKDGNPWDGSITDWSKTDILYRFGKTSQTDTQTRYNASVGNTYQDIQAKQQEDSEASAIEILRNSEDSLYNSEVRKYEAIGNYSGGMNFELGKLEEKRKKYMADNADIVGSTEYQSMMKSFANNEQEIKNYWEPMIENQNSVIAANAKQWEIESMEITGKIASEQAARLYAIGDVAGGLTTMLGYYASEEEFAIGQDPDNEEAIRKTYALKRELAYEEALTYQMELDESYAKDTAKRNEAVSSLLESYRGAYGESYGDYVAVQVQSLKASGMYDLAESLEQGVLDYAYTQEISSIDASDLSDKEKAEAKKEAEKTYNAKSATVSSDYSTLKAAKEKAKKELEEKGILNAQGLYTESVSKYTTAEVNRRIAEGDIQGAKDVELDAINQIWNPIITDYQKNLDNGVEGYSQEALDYLKDAALNETYAVESKYMMLESEEALKKEQERVKAEEDAFIAELQDSNTANQVVYYCSFNEGLYGELRKGSYVYSLIDSTLNTSLTKEQITDDIKLTAQEIIQNNSSLSNPQAYAMAKLYLENIDLLKYIGQDGLSNYTGKDGLQILANNIADANQYAWRDLIVNYGDVTTVDGKTLKGMMNDITNSSKEFQRSLELGYIPDEPYFREQVANSKIISNNIIVELAKCSSKEQMDYIWNTQYATQVRSLTKADQERVKSWYSNDGSFIREYIPEGYDFKKTVSSITGDNGSEIMDNVLLPVAIDAAEEYLSSIGFQHNMFVYADFEKHLQTSLNNASALFLTTTGGFNDTTLREANKMFSEEDYDSEKVFDAIAVTKQEGNIKYYNSMDANGTNFKYFSDSTLTNVMNEGIGSQDPGTQRAASIMKVVLDSNYGPDPILGQELADCSALFVLNLFHQTSATSITSEADREAIREQYVDFLAGLSPAERNYVEALTIGFQAKTTEHRRLDDGYGDFIELKGDSYFVNGYETQINYNNDGSFQSAIINVDGKNVDAKYATLKGRKELENTINKPNDIIPQALYVEGKASINAWLSDSENFSGTAMEDAKVAQEAAYPGTTLSYICGEDKKIKAIVVPKGDSYEENAIAFIIDKHKELEQLMNLCQLDITTSFYDNNNKFSGNVIDQLNRINTSLATQTGTSTGGRMKVEVVYDPENAYADVSYRIVRENGSPLTGKYVQEKTNAVK